MNYDFLCWFNWEGVLYNRFSYLNYIVECGENQMELNGHSDLINETI